MGEKPKGITQKKWQEKLDVNKKDITELVHKRN
jgi:plasmid maintenance system antidote protein VapI